MRLLTSALCTTVAVGLLAGCSGSNLGSTGTSLPGVGTQVQSGPRVAPLSIVPSWMHPAGVGRLHLNLRLVPNKKSTGLIYASEFLGYEVFGYPNPNSGNNPASCTLGSASNYLYYVNGFGVDPKGNVMLPAYTGKDSGYLSINVYKPNCGAQVWQAEIDTGQPADAYSSNALTGKVLVGLLADYDDSDHGAALICTQSGGCGTALTNSSMTGYAAGVAMAKNGDCWVSGEEQSNSGFVLIYFKGCTGSGTVATGTSNAYYGGLFIDTKGNLGSIDLSGTLYVYKGCNPTCSLVSTTTLAGESLFGGLNSKGNQLAIGDVGNGTVDVYTYSPTSGATYSYSFSNGLTASDDVEAAHFAPSNKKV